MRVVIAEDMPLLREGLARLLADEDIEVVDQVDNPASLLAAVTHDRPDVALIDIKLPPTWTDEGLQAAITIRSSHPAPPYYYCPATSTPASLPRSWKRTSRPAAICSRNMSQIEPSWSTRYDASETVRPSSTPPSSPTDGSPARGRAPR